MAALSWDEIVDRGKQKNKTVICEIFRGRDRLFRVRCDLCNYESELVISRFSNCANCKLCRKLSNEEFILKAKILHGNKYDYSLVDYVNNKIKIKIICTTCNKLFEQRPSLHLSGSGCPICGHIASSNKKKFDNDEFILKSKKMHGDKYCYDLVEYINSYTKVKIICNNCNNVFHQNPGEHKRGAGCPRCNESKGENRVAKYLSENNIRFTKDKIFETLRDKSYLKPDFYLDDLNLLIEYDGEFHYKALIGSTQENKQKNLETQQRRDRIKDEWAKANNIPLLRIPYWDYCNIEELIGEFILIYSRKEIVQLVLDL